MYVAFGLIEKNSNWPMFYWGQKLIIKFQKDLQINIIRIL